MEASTNSVKHLPQLGDLRRWRDGDADAQDILNWQTALGERLPQLPMDLLDPSLLPVKLLQSPDQWRPEHSGLDHHALLASHPALKDPGQLLPSGILKAILQGDVGLYADLPPIHIAGYRDGLRPTAQHPSLSALEHLATIGHDLFHAGRPLGKDIDRYQPPIEDPLPASADNWRRPVLIVLHDANDEAATQSDSNAPDWTEVRHGSLNDLSCLQSFGSMKEADLVSICHASDQLDPQAAFRISAFAAQHPETVLFTSDEILRWSPDPGIPAGNRQNRTVITPLRLLCRGCLGGLVTLRRSALETLQWPERVLSLHELLLDLALQICRREQAMAHCPEVLLQRSIAANPSIPDVASPADRKSWTVEQIQHLFAITRKQGTVLLHPGGSLDSIPSMPGCHRLRLKPEPSTLVSVLIPFRDRVDLSRGCVDSFRRCAGAIRYELILIDNGSEEPATKAWLESQSQCNDVSIVRVDGPFNYARINNIGRSQARGTHLLLLNNDVEFRSPDVLQALLNPFAYRHTSAVGARLNYPDGSIQHQGVVLVTGERRCVVEPGKHLQSIPVLNTLTPLQVEEEFSAATAACLLIRSSDFDQIGGLDESLAVVFNDVDLCLRLREQGGSIVVTPFVEIVHHESISRGKDRLGLALARHQRESGYLRAQHAGLFASGDPLTSQLIHPHSNRYQPRNPPHISAGKVPHAVLRHWRKPGFQPSRDRPILLLAHFSNNGRIRDDLFSLLAEYDRHADVILVSSAAGLRWHLRTLHRLRRYCKAIIIRRNRGYDFGSWKTGLHLYGRDIDTAGGLVLTNDSFWGPITPLDDLFRRINTSSADVIGLTDDLMYEPHLSSAFTAYSPEAFRSDAFQSFWCNLQLWPRKRDLIKQCEVGFPVRLRKAGLRLESLYTHNANGNVLHYDWKALIEEKAFPFIKVSLLRDNPTQQPIDDWWDVIQRRNPKLAEQISRELKTTRHSRGWLPSI